MTEPTPLVIVQPHVPQYRVALFDRLHKELESSRIDLTIVCGSPVGAHSQRAEVGERMPWMSQVASSRIALPGGRSIVVKRIQSEIRRLKPELLIVEQAIKNLEIYPYILGPRTRRPSVAMWGHGRTFSITRSSIESSIKDLVTKRADWVFVYTKSGAEHLAAQSFPQTRLTVLNNTIDTDELKAELKGVAESEVANFRQRLGLTAGRTALFLGGVDENKGIEFLIDAATRAVTLMPDFTLLVGGEGGSRSRCEQAAANGAPIRVLGRLDGHDKALALRASDVLAVPEWIGLVAVDSLVSGCPIVSTNHVSHSPERAYLEDGVTARFADHELDSYAAALVDSLADEPLLRAMQLNCRKVGEQYSLEAMVQRFRDGILAWDDVRRFGL